MKEWIPFLQTAIWPVFIGILIWKFYPKLMELFDLVIKRIAEGNPIKFGSLEVGGYDYGDQKKEFNKEVKEQVKQVENDDIQFRDKTERIKINILKLNKAITAFAKRPTTTFLVDIIRSQSVDRNFDRKSLKEKVKLIQNKIEPQAYDDLLYIIDLWNKKELTDKNIDNILLKSELLLDYFYYLNFSK